jgi:hypothetical protein
VCLNPECYQKTWHELIDLELEEAAGEHGGSREVTKIAFCENIPRHLYEKATEVEFAGKKYEVLNPHAYILGDEKTDRKKNTYWRVSYIQGGIRVERCGYESREAHKKNEAKRMEQNLVTAYSNELLESLGTQLEERPETIAQNIKTAGMDNYDVRNLIQERIWHRAREEHLSGKESRNYAALYFRHLAPEGWEKFLEKYTGFTELESVPVNAEAQGLFHFLINLAEFYECRPPALEELAKTDKRYRKELFWEYAGVDEERYRAWYLEEGRKIVEHLKNGGTAKELEEEEEV